MALIYTTKGDIEESLLRKVQCPIENHPGGLVAAVEYYLGDEMVKREVVVLMKQLTLGGEQGSFNG